jgi:hypothetical protein
MNTFKKDLRRNVSYQKEWENAECWNLSLKYSKLLVKNINSSELYSLCLGIYSQYVKELNSRNLPYKNKNYLQVWETMINTVKKDEKSIQAVKLLHQTNRQHSV